MSHFALDDIVLKGQDNEWQLELIKVLEQPPSDVWSTLTQRHLMVLWGPYEPDRNLDAVGPVQLAPINVPGANSDAAAVLEVDPPRLLEMRWGQDILRWELITQSNGTRLSLHHRFLDRKLAPSYAAGWHLCLEGLAGILAGREMPSMVGMEASKHGWDALYAQYAQQLEVSEACE